MTHEHTITMTHDTDIIGRTARRTAMVAIPLLVAVPSTAAAQAGGYGGGMMGGGWGLFGVGMGLWGLLWMGLLVAIPVYIVYALLDRSATETETRPLSVLRERYARGELTDEEFEQRRKQLEESR